jgi:Domain of unknown function (DUF3560)
MRPYAERRAARIARLEERAATKKDDAAAAFRRADQIANVIPLGQPILVGELATLERNAVRAATKEPELYGDIRVEESENRVRIYFPGKPSEALRSLLKSRGFRWSPSEGAWQRMAGENAWWNAREIAKGVSK